ncbi:MAG TPA: hypothetical protein VNU68_11970 [Verrucomicrobiae bacterium]|nr:hypothetical protein [Verrucomicrobiae bacterium]
MQKIFGILTLAAAFIASAGFSTARAEGCGNVGFQGIAQLGLIEVAPGVFTLGALPTPVVIAGVPGLMSSIVTGQRATDGAIHYTLVHTFVSTDPARPGGFTTSDQAVAAPAGTDPNLAIINDVLTVVSGTGVFANPDGFMVNHALLDLNNFTLAVSLRGRICSDGL